MMHDLIAHVARELYEEGGRIDGRDLDNWLEAEKIVRTDTADETEYIIGIVGFETYLISQFY